MFPYRFGVEPDEPPPPPPKTWGLETAALVLLFVFLVVKLVRRGKGLSSAVPIPPPAPRLVSPWNPLP